VHLEALLLQLAGEEPRHLLYHVRYVEVNLLQPQLASFDLESSNREVSSLYFEALSTAISVGAAGQLRSEKFEERCASKLYDCHLKVQLPSLDLGMRTEK
jgi:hypothetical protein